MTFVSCDDANPGLSIWTPEFVQVSLEWLALRAALAQRRAIWLTRLFDASLVWREPGDSRARLLDAAEGLARTLTRLHADRGIAIDLHVATDHVFRGEAQDLDEMLGNLLDNACKWARSRVTVTSTQAEGSGRVTVAVEDDGPGVEPGMREQVLHRGVRADEAAPGSGIGLAIVRELAELYGGTISLGASTAGGLRAVLDLPAADSASS